MAELLKLNVTAIDVADADKKAHLYKKLAQHLHVENWQIEITITDANPITQEQLDELGKQIKALKGDVETFDATIPQATG